MAQLVGVLVVALQIPIRGGGYNEMDRIVIEE
jgi:hypothetical protein